MVGREGVQNRVASPEVQVEDPPIFGLLPAPGHLASGWKSHPPMAANSELFNIEAVILSDWRFP